MAVDALRCALCRLPMPSDEFQSRQLDRELGRSRPTRLVRLLVTGLAVAAALAGL